MVSSFQFFTIAYFFTIIERLLMIKKISLSIIIAKNLYKNISLKIPFFHFNAIDYLDLNLKFICLLDP